ncbi:MAG: hypothetical protein EZS28_051070, partial [Streblomastix strix]
KKELPWIDPPIPLLLTVLKKIREEEIDAMIIAPLQPEEFETSARKDKLFPDRDSLLSASAISFLTPGS